MIQNFQELTYKYNMQKVKGSHLRMSAFSVVNMDIGQGIVQRGEVRTGMMIAGTDTTIVDTIMDLPEEDHMTGPHQEGIMTPIWIDALPLAEIIIVVMVIITEVAALQGPLQDILELMKVTQHLVMGMELAGIKCLEFLGG